MTANPTEISIGDIVAMMNRHRHRALCVFAVLMVAGFVYIALAPRTYRSEGRLYLRLGRENATLDSITTMRTDPTVVVPASRENELNSAVDILNSRLMAELVVEELTPDVVLGNAPLPSNHGENAKTTSGFSVLSLFKRAVRECMIAVGISDRLDSRETAILEFSAGLIVSRKRDSNVIDVAFQGDSPKLTQAICESMLKNFVKHHIKLNRSEGAFSFLNEQKEQLLVSLTESENQVNELQESTGLISPEEQRHALVAQISSLEDEIRRNEANLVSIETEVDTLENILRTLPEKKVITSMDGVSNQGTDGIRQQLYALQVQEQGLSAKYTNTHPSLVAVRKQLEDAEELMKAQIASQTHVTTGVNREFEEMQLALSRRLPEQAAVTSKLNALKNQHKSAVKQLSLHSQNELKLIRLEREVEAKRGDYKKYVSAVEQARIEEALSVERISNIQIAQHASFQPRPVKPQKPIIAALTFAVAIAGSFLTAIASELIFKNRKGDQEDLTEEYEDEIDDSLDEDEDEDFEDDEDFDDFEDEGPNYIALRRR